MDPMQIARLKEEHEKGLRCCEEKITQWEKFKKDYETLQQRLETLPNALTYDVTVPFGSNAFTKGKLVHTNELLVLLGDNWFAEVSAKQAEALAGRRIKQCLSMLQDLEKEQKQFQNWLSYIDEVSNQEELVEIVEKYDEEQEKKWRAQHAENLKSHRRKLAEQKLLETTPSNRSESFSEDDLHLQMDDLDLTESNGDSTTSDDSSQHLEDVKEKRSGLKLKIGSGRDRCKSPESEDDLEEEDEIKSTPPTPSSPGGSSGGGKHVRWQDLSKQNVTKITFKHSRKGKNKHRLKQQDSSEGEEQPLIQSPSDIYAQFGSFFPSSPPKSILKVKNSPPTGDEPPFPSHLTNSEPITSAFTGEVHQHSEPVAIVGKKSARPSSHFKNSRKNRKR